MIPRRNLFRLIRKALVEPGYALRALNQRLRSYLSYNIGRGYSSYPETISLFLTFNCNLRCTMCGYWGNRGSLKNAKDDTLKENLKLSDLKKVIDEVDFFKPNITLFGGEPFLYPDWPQLIRYIKNKGLRSNVVTNGTLLFGREEEIIDSRIDEIIFSLEGPRQVHDRITNISGSFDKAFSALEKISRLKKQKMLEGPKISVAVTICEDNFSFLFETFEVATRLNPESITFHHLSFVDKDTIIKTNEILEKHFSLKTRDWQGFLRTSLPRIDVPILIEQINKIRKDHRAGCVFFYPDFGNKEIFEFYSNFNFKSKDFGNRCLSPWMTAYIFPDGSVGPCEELNLYFGNIKERSFKEIWNNQAFRRFRRILKKEKIFPVCTRCTELYRF